MSNADSHAGLPELSAFLVKYRSLPLFRGQDWDGGTRRADAEAFVRDLETLGPTFIKLGQVLSTRPDLLPPAYIAALERLQDEVRPIPFEDYLAQLEAGLGMPARRIFKSVDPVPLGTASLAQVHAATLRDGCRVAVKVQRPGLASRVESELATIERILAPIGMLGGLERRYGFGDWLGEFSAALREELDYLQEAANLDLFGARLRDYPRISVPSPFWDYTSRTVLTMELAEGIRVTDIPGVLRPELDGAGLAAELMRAYLDQVFNHGLIHADPHPGNVVLTPGHRIILLDLGMVAHVSPRMRGHLLKLVLASVDGRGEQVAELMAHMGTRLEDFDEAGLVRDVGRCVARYSSGVSLEGEGALLATLLRAGAKRGLRPPPELAMLGKTLLNLESVSDALDPGGSLSEVLAGERDALVARRLAQGFSPGRLATEAAELQGLVREAPQRLSMLLRTLADNRFRVQVTGLEEARLIEGIQKIANRITAGVIAAAMIVGAALIMDVPTRFRLFGYPALALALFLAAAGLGAALVVSSLLGDRRARPRADRDLL